MRSHKELFRLSRNPIANRYFSAQEEQVSDYTRAAPPAHESENFLTREKIIWALKNIPHLGNSRHKYSAYSDSTDKGVYHLKNHRGFDEVRIALLSDWATNTRESDDIAKAADSCIPDYTIHLGDTYYTGTEKEVEENFGPQGWWRNGRVGAFALPGNHEMYSNGKAYFQNLLPKMGIDDGVERIPQKAAFFCLESDYWRVIGLDTGYYSLKGLFGLTPNTELQLHNDQIDWLKNVVHLEKDMRGIILLSHHQYCSAFTKRDMKDKVFSDDEFQNPAVQLAKLIGPERPVLWFWGHEHRMSVYGCYQGKDGIKAFGRCIGHSGMPTEILSDANMFRTDAYRKQAGESRKLVLFDNRYRETIDNTPLGHNGYVMLRLNKENLIAEYYDEKDKILSEKWSIDIITGKLNGISITDFTMGTYPSTPEDNKTKLFHFTQNIKDAISSPVNVPI
ncbi:MAG TPA: metallophosphoesterase [Chitinophagales bacterium]|nr:metallophosphoesterase [Chitinophagales bacterium]